MERERERRRLQRLAATRVHPNRTGGVRVRRARRPPALGRHRVGRADERGTRASASDRGKGPTRSTPGVGRRAARNARRRGADEEGDEARASGAGRKRGRGRARYRPRPGTNAGAGSECSPGGGGDGLKKGDSEMRFSGSERFERRIGERRNKVVRLDDRQRAGRSIERARPWKRNVTRGPLKLPPPGPEGPPPHPSRYALLSESFAMSASCSACTLTSDSYSAVSLASSALRPAVAARAGPAAAATPPPPTGCASPPRGASRAPSEPPDAREGEERRWRRDGGRIGAAGGQRLVGGRCASRSGRREEKGTVETVRRCGGRISRSTRACWSTASTTVLTMSSSCATLSQKSAALDDNCRALLNFSESSTRTRILQRRRGRGTFGRQLTAARWDETRRAREFGAKGRARTRRATARRRGGGSPRAPRRTSPRVRPTSSPCGCASAMPRGPQRPRQKDFALERGRHRGRRGNQLCFFKSRGGAGFHALRRDSPSRSMDARAFSSPTPEPHFSTASGAPVSDPSPDTMDRARSLLDRLPSPRAPVRPPHTAARSPASRRSPTPASANGPDDRPLATDTPRRRA